jgi:hypothetical protein
MSISVLRLFLCMTAVVLRARGKAGAFTRSVGVRFALVLDTARSSYPHEPYRREQ